MVFTGRKNFNKTGRVTPSVRLRQVAFGDKPARRQSFRGGFLTPAGWAITLGGLAVICFFAWFFVFSANFLVNSLEITEPTSLNKEQIDSVFYNLQDKRILFWIPGNHIMLLSASRVSKAFNKSYPYIAGVENFKKDWPDKVSFSVAEISPVFFYINSEGRRFLIDERGIAIGEPLGELDLGLVELTGITEAPIFGERLAGAKFLPLILDIQKNWPWPDFKPAKFEIKSQLQEFTLTTTESWYIKVTGSDKPANVLKNLALILENEIKGNRGNLAYIDLRLSNRAFFCLIGQPCARK